MFFQNKVIIYSISQTAADYKGKILRQDTEFEMNIVGIQPILFRQFRPAGMRTDAAVFIIYAYMGRSVAAQFIGMGGFK